MIKQFNNGRIVRLAAIAAATWLTISPAWAGYVQPGYDLQVVQSEQGVTHAGISYLSNPTWAVSGRGTNVNTSFVLPSFQDVRFARLYLDIWGGNNAYTSTVTASLNGTALGTVSINGTSDANPIFDATKTCVYGSGSGMWQIGYSGIAGLLKKDGTPDLLSFRVTDPAGNFDGRTVCASLVSVYTDPSVNQALDYYLAEADGTLRIAPGINGSPAVRTLALAGINNSNVTSATYIAGYTHGTTGQADQLLFDGHLLGSNPNDVALGTTTDYGPNSLPFDVTSYLAGTNSVRYSVASADVGPSGESYLRANIGLLEVAHPLPEPSTVALLATGAALFLVRGWKKVGANLKRAASGNLSEAPRT